MTINCAVRFHLMCSTLLALLVVVAVVVAVVAASARAEPVEVRFRAGAAAVDITPQVFPVVVSGGFLEGTGTVAHDQLMARALVLDDGATRLAIVVVDSLMMRRELLDQAKELAHQATGIAVERMLISSTHTHSAPSCMACLGSRIDERYSKRMPQWIAQSITQANERLSPARIGWAAVQDHDHNHCRRWIFRPDRLATDPFGERNVRAHMHPGNLSPNHIGPSGPADPDMSVLAVAHADGRPMAVLANYAMHYYGAAPVSGDAAGRFGLHFAAMIREHHAAPIGDDFVGMLSQGTSGDSMWMNYAKPATHIGLDAYTDALAQSAMRACQTIEYRDHVSLAMAESTLKLNRRVPDEARLRWARQIVEPMGDRLPANLQEVYAREQIYLHEEPQVELKLQAIRIGDLGITAIPNEVYGITGLKIKAQSPLTTTFNIELANGAQGYIPPAEQHFLGGYTTWPARTAGLEVQAESRITETILNLLEKVAKRPRRPFIDPENDYTKAVIASDPAAMWRMGEMTGPRAHDTIGQQHGMYEDGVVFFLPGPEGTGLIGGERGNRAAHFAGGRMSASIKSPGERYTVEFWVWNGMPTDARDVTGYLYALGGTPESNSPEEWVAIGGTGQDAFGRLLVGVGNDSKHTLIGQTELRRGAWNHVALVRDGKRVTVYLNGTAKPDIIGDLPVRPSSPTDQLWIAGRGKHIDGLEGRIDEFTLYTRALKADEIIQHVNASGFAPPPKPKPSSTARNKPSTAAALDRYGEAIATSKPLAWWTMHEAENRSVKDEANGRHPGKLEDNASTRKPGESAPNFTGGRMRATLDNLGDTYSVEMWFWNGLANDARAVTGYFFSRGEDLAAGAPGDHMGIGGSHIGAGRLLVFNGNDRDQVLAGETLIRPRTWNHVLMVRQGTTVRVYLNGDPTPEIEGELTITYPPRGGQVFIGGRNENYANFQGMIDQVAIYNRALSPEAFARHYKASGLEPPSYNSSSMNGESNDQPQLDSQPKSPRDALASWRVRPGFEIELVAAEPLVSDPVAIDWGADGKLWVAEMHDYPLGVDGRGKPGGRIRILEDTNGDGRYDRSTVFMEGLNFPNGVMAWGRGVLITAAPEILYAEDTDHDNRADVTRVLFAGFSQGNQQLRVNGLRWGLDNWVYCASGAHHIGYGRESQIRAVDSGLNVAIGSRDFRIRPNEGLIDPQSGPSQFGRNRDDWGNWFGQQNSYPLWHYVLADHYTRRNPHAASPDPRRLLSPQNPRVYIASEQQKRFHSFNESGRFTSACSGMVYRDELLFPRNSTQHAFTCEPFHNVVQHNLLHEDGVSFNMQRDPQEVESDFLTSTDRWCRPVMARTGPDGALWIVDMYRYMIEHPDWLPESGRTELKPFYRAGDDRGRIYRVYPKGTQPRDVPRMDTLNTAELVAALADPNGIVRDMAQRLLLDGNDAQAIAPLKGLLENSTQPLARLHALCTLDGLGAIDVPVLTNALTDYHPAIRRHALRIAEPFGEDDPSLVTSALRLVDDPDPKVRLQLAFTLGQWKGTQVGSALGRMMAAATEQPYLTAAVMSSINADNLGDALTTAFKGLPAHAENGNNIEVDLGPLFALSAAYGGDDVIEKALRLVSTSPTGRFECWQFAALASILDSFALKNAETSRPLDQSLLDSVRPALCSAREYASNVDAPVDVRQASVRLLLRDPTWFDDDLKLAASLLTPTTPAPIQTAMLEHLEHQSDPAIASVILANWSSCSPPMRARVLAAIAARSSWIKTFIIHIDDRTIHPNEIDPVSRERLLTQTQATADLNVALRRRLTTQSNADGDTILATLKPALTIKGDPKRGAVHFQNRCATCHKLGVMGNEVGPNLDSVTDRSPQALLEAILDPNRSVEPKYAQYIATLLDGRMFSGVLSVETGNSITLVGGDGNAQVILRHQIESLRSTTLSLMPEGLAADMTPTDLADLFGFINQAH